MATRTDTHEGQSQIRCTKCRRSGWITYDARTVTSDDDNMFRQSTTLTHTPTGTVKTLSRKGDLDSFRFAAARRTFDCGHPLKAVTVTGVISTEHDCDAKCLSAIGPSCECSCGGTNHGTGHGAW